MICLLALFVASAMFGTNESEVKYSEVVNQLIAAETLNNAKDILKSYGPLDENTLRWHLAERQTLWYAEHGLYDQCKMMHGIEEIHRSVCAFVFGAMSLGAFAISAPCLYVLLRYGYYDCYSIKHISLGLMTGILSGLLSRELINAKSSGQKDLDEFKRIKELLACIG